MIDETEIVDFFEDIATRHVDIRHTLNGKVAFLEGDVEELNEDIGGINSPNYVLLLETGSGVYTGDNEFSTMDNSDIAFIICKPALLRNKPAEREVFSKSKTIMTEILMYIRKKQEEGNTTFDDFDLNAIQYNKLRILTNNYCGYRAQFSLKAQVQITDVDDKFIDP
jgi:hypothetical protein